MSWSARLLGCLVSLAVTQAHAAASSSFDELQISIAMLGATRGETLHEECRGAAPRGLSPSLAEAAERLEAAGGDPLLAKGARQLVDEMAFTWQRRKEAIDRCQAAASEWRVELIHGDRSRAAALGERAKRCLQDLTSGASLMTEQAGRCMALRRQVLWRLEGLEPLLPRQLTAVLESTGSRLEGMVERCSQRENGETRCDLRASVFDGERGWLGPGSLSGWVSFAERGGALRPETIYIVREALSCADAAAITRQWWRRVSGTLGKGAVTHDPNQHELCAFIESWVHTGDYRISLATLGDEEDPPSYISLVRIEPTALWGQATDRSRLGHYD